MISVSITTKGQVTIPRDVRIALGASTGDRVVFTPLSNGTAVVSVVLKDVSTSLFGSLTSVNRAVDHAAVRRETARKMAKKYLNP